MTPQKPDAAPEVHPVIASREPYEVELLAGYRYAYCACGLSKFQPFCDGSHTSSPAKIQPVIWTQKRDQKALLCGCKRTNRPPFCDATHENL